MKILADEEEENEQEQKPSAGNVADPHNTTMNVDIVRIIQEQQQKNAQLQGQGTPETHSLAGGCQPIAMPVPA